MSIKLDVYRTTERRKLRRTVLGEINLATEPKVLFNSRMRIKIPQGKVLKYTRAKYYN